MCKKWYQLITCTEPVGALNRRSFFMLKSPVSNSRMRGFLSLLLVLVSLQVSDQKCVRLASLWHQLDVFLQVSAGIWTLSAGFLLPHQLLNSSC